MGKRLPPGEAERRAAERKRKLWGGETKHTYNPETEGYGNSQEWRENADKLAKGEVESIVKIDDDLTLLGVTELPTGKKGLDRAYRKAVSVLFRQYGSDTDPVYKEKFIALTDAYNRLQKRITE